MAKGIVRGNFQDGSRCPNVHHIPSGARAGQPRVPLANCGLRPTERRPCWPLWHRGIDLETERAGGKVGGGKVTLRPRSAGRNRWADLSGNICPFPKALPACREAATGWSVAADFELKVDRES